jgi:hypothetical protein
MLLLPLHYIKRYVTAVRRRLSQIGGAGIGTSGANKLPDAARK